MYSTRKRWIIYFYGYYQLKSWPHDVTADGLLDLAGLLGSDGLLNLAGLLGSDGLLDLAGLLGLSDLALDWFL